MTTAERNAKIVELVGARQQTLREIGAAFGITHERVRQIASYRGVNRGRRDLREDEKLAAASLFCRGMPIAHIAEKLRRSKSAIGVFLVDAGLHEHAKTDRPWSDAETDLVRRQYGKVRVRAIAERLGRTRNEVIGKAHRLGIEARAS